MLNDIERKLLTVARSLIETGKEIYICDAISQAARTNHGTGTMQAETRLRNYIREQIGNRFGLEDWQLANGLYNRSKEQQRADRLAWIDWMLEE